MDVELHIFPEGVQDSCYARGDLDTVALLPEDVLDYCEDLPKCYIYQLPIVLHQRPKFIGHGKDAVPMVAEQEIASYPVCPLFGHTTSTGWAETAVATGVNGYSISTVFALEEDIALAGVMAEEHPLHFFELMPAERRFM
jgi:hypothetical protein